MRHKGETAKQFEARFYAELEAWAKHDVPFPQCVAVLTIPVDDAIGKAIKANPDSVRISATGADGIPIIGARPRRNREGIKLRLHYADRNGELVDDDVPNK